MYELTMHALSGEKLVARLQRSRNESVVAITDPGGTAVSVIRVADLAGLGRFLELPLQRSPSSPTGRRPPPLVELGPIEVARLKDLPEASRRWERMSQGPTLRT
jgi:hypothetical protein